MEGGGGTEGSIWHPVKTFLKCLQIFQSQFHNSALKAGESLEALANNLRESCFCTSASRGHMQFIQSWSWMCTFVVLELDNLAPWQNYSVVLNSLQKILPRTLKRKNKGFGSSKTGSFDPVKIYKTEEDIKKQLLNSQEPVVCSSFW